MEANPNRRSLARFYDEILLFFKATALERSAEIPAILVPYRYPIKYRPAFIDKVLTSSDNYWETEWRQLFSTLWTGFDSHFADIISRLERHTTLVDHEALAANLTQAHTFRIAAHKEFEESMQERQRRISEDVKGWLSPLSFEDDLQRCQDITEMCPNTGRWLLNDARFNLWLNEDLKPILWLSGIPGSGKHPRTNRIFCFMMLRLS